MSKQVTCFQCGEKIAFSERLGLREECPKCHSDLHVCKNCEFYDPKVYNECRENQAEVIREKDRANRCDFFRPSGEGRAKGDESDALKRAAEALFKK